MNHDAKRFFRITAPGAARAVVEGLLKAEGYAFEPEPFFTAARVLTDEPRPLGRSLAARLGLIHIQDRSSMLPPLALFSFREQESGPGRLVLDLCAAPGGKTGILAGLVGPEGLVVACEPSPDRLAVLRANLARTGAVNTATLRVAAERLPWTGTEGSGLVSRILLDPPCSGWGTTDKHPRARELWQGARVEPMIRLQRKLLARAAELLAPGGRLVYSTCTTNPDENEAQVRHALDKLGLVLRPLDPPPGFLFDRADLDGVLRVSEASEGQGFFVACLEKPGPEDVSAGLLSEPPPESVSEPVVGALSGIRLDPAELDCPRATDFSGLPPGQVWDFGGKAVFLHDLALAHMPAKAVWQGHVLGRVSDGAFRPAATARVLLGPESGEGMVDLDAAELGDLLSGASLDKGLTGDGLVGISYQGLAVGWARLRSGRLLSLGS